MPLSKSPVRKRGGRSTRPQELMAAALELFVEKGFSATRLDDIATAASVSKATIYLYFPDKRALLLSSLQRGLVSSLPRVATPNRSTDAETLLRALVMEWREALEFRGLGKVAKLVFAESPQFPEIAQAWSQMAIKPTRKAIQYAVSRQDVFGVVSDMQINILTHALLMPLIACSVYGLAGFSTSFQVFPDLDEKFAEQHLNTVLYGLLARSSSWS